MREEEEWWAGDFGVMESGEKLTVIPITMNGRKIFNMLSSKDPGRKTSESCIILEPGGVD